MDLQRNVLYMYLVVLLFQTFVSTSSLEVHEVEILEEDMESELDAVIQLLQEVRDIKQELTRTRRNSGHESEISVIGTSYLRRRRTHPGNRRIVEVRKCRLARRRGQWPSYCDRLLRQRTADGTQIASSGI